MYLTEVNMGNIVKKQYQYKLQSYIGVFTSLVITQIIAILFSLGGTGGSGSSSDTYSFQVDFYSGNLILAFTMIWVIATSITMTTRAYRYEDFTYVTNRLSSNLSNYGILLTLSFIGGISSVMASLFLKLLIVFSNKNAYVTGEVLSPQEFTLGIIVAALYMLMLSAIGYFVGVLGQINRLLFFVVPLIIVGILYQETRMDGIVSFFTKETSFVMFITKIIVSVAILFIGSIVLSNRLEVRK